MRLDRPRQRLDIDRLVMIGRNRAHRRHEPCRHERFERLVVHRRRGRRRILRIEREDEDTVASLLAQRGHALVDRRLAVPHPPVADDLRVAGQGLGELFGLRTRIGAQIALVALLVPDRFISLADLARPRVQDDAEQDRVPHCLGPFDHALVGQELLQIAPHRCVVGAVRRSQIDQQHPDLLDLHGRMVRRQRPDGPGSFTVDCRCYGHGRLSFGRNLAATRPNSILSHAALRAAENEKGAGMSRAPSITIRLTLISGSPVPRQL